MNTPIKYSKTITNHITGHRDFTTSGSDLVEYENGQYDSLIIDINAALHSVGYVKINIYNDGSGNSFATDSNGNNITSRTLTSNSYTFPFTDVNNNFHDGIIKLVFDDGSTFQNNDINFASNGIDARYWYSIDGIVPNTIKQFT